MNFITSILSLLWILIVGTPQPKHSLYKQPTRDDSVESGTMRNFINGGVI